MNNFYRQHIFVYGRVQGVGFRASTRREAQKIGIMGWVKNKRDGSVEIIAEGTKTDLSKLHKFLAQGPSRAEVEKVEVQDQEEIKKCNFSDFKIEY